MNKKCELKKNVNLKEYNTYRIAAECHYMALPSTVEDLTSLVNYDINHNIKYKAPLRLFFVFQISCNVQSADIVK